MLAQVGQAAGFRGLPAGPRRSVSVFAVFAILALAGCSNSLKPRIDAETRKVAEAKDRFLKIRADVEEKLKKDPELFRTANVTAAWRDRFQSDQEKLNDAFSALERLNHHDKKLSLFSDVERFRDAAVTDATAIQKEANHWLDLKNNTESHLRLMKSDYEKIKAADTSAVVATLEKAESDWPAKKPDLDARIESLRGAPEKAEKVWYEAQQAAAKPDYAALMTAEEWLQSRVNRPDKDLKLAAQLYQGRDIILEHLGSPRDLTCAAQLKIINTQFTDVQNQKSTTETKQKTETFPESRCESLKNDIGMEIEHKPAGAYETEVQRFAQPPGFAYMAPPGQRNQYGYWEQHNGTSVWTWLPQYLLLRELLWNHSYMPVPAYEYEGYWSARRSGTTYYGGGYSGTGSNTQVQSAPKYGTHGTFTERSYAGSRYQNKGGSFSDSKYKNQGGGYRDSGYSSGQSVAPSNRSSDQGHQFGTAPRSGSNSGIGKRFGSPGGSPRSAPRSSPSGRRFGRR